MLARFLVILAVLLLLLIGPLALLALIALLIGLTFVASAWEGHPRAPAPALTFGERVLLWAGEIAAAWSVFLVWMPLERWLMPRDTPAARPGSVPVLLIHGYVNNAGALWRLWRALRTQGMGVYTLNLEPVYGDIDDYAPRVAARIDAIRAATGAESVVVVGHSMGGLVTRAYLRYCALQHRVPGIAKVVTLGTPHRGTALARIEWSRNGHQMVPGNAWLAALAAHESGAWPCPLVSIYSLDDNVVVPQRNARLEGARNMELAGVGHISLPLSSQVIGLVLAETCPAPAPLD